MSDCPIHGKSKIASRTKPSHSSGESGRVIGGGAARKHIACSRSDVVKSDDNTRMRADPGEAARLIILDDQRPVREVWKRKEIDDILSPAVWPDLHPPTGIQRILNPASASLLSGECDRHAIFIAREHIQCVIERNHHGFFQSSAQREGHRPVATEGRLR